MDHAKSKQEAAEWAQTVLAMSTAVIMDFETTGIKDAEIVQIGIINMKGETLMQTLVKPTKRIELGAFGVHGISNEQVKDAPDFKDLYARFSGVIAGQTVIAYNVDFEKSILKGVCARRKIPQPRVKAWQCAMKEYARFYGKYHATRRSYIWQSLSNACSQQNILVKAAHDAIGDCLLTLEVIRKMANST
jgi:DNA polymerase-3 subunit epsilon